MLRNLLYSRLDKEGPTGAALRPKRLSGLATLKRHHRL